MLTVGSLFSGIGGMEYGLEMTGGFQVKWQVEIDPWCRRVLQKHWPDVTKYGDIRDIDFQKIEPVDLVCAGFPCQPISNAGKRLGAADDRWLWPEVERAVRMVRPRFVLLENVSALLGRGMHTVLASLATCGYDAEWDCIPASAVGAPHERDRVWIIAYPQGVTEREPADQAHTITDRGQAWSLTGRGAWWDTEPRVRRVVDGISPGVDRRRGLGNAVVPQVVAWIGERILEAEARP